MEIQELTLEDEIAVLDQALLEQLIVCIFQDTVKKFSNSLLFHYSNVLLKTVMVL